MASPSQIRRIIEELAESGLNLDSSEPWHEMAATELGYARFPVVHEQRVPSYGAIIAPTVSAWAWDEAAGLTIDRRPVGQQGLDAARRYADGISSWVIRHASGKVEGSVFDRPAGSERDLVVLSNALGCKLVQRHPAGLIRLVGSFGVYRWDGMAWKFAPPIETWLSNVTGCTVGANTYVMRLLLAFAVHDLAARNIGATLIYRSPEDDRGSYEPRLPLPPPLRVTRPADLAPLRHVLGQVDGATIFDTEGLLTEVGVRLIPSAEAELKVGGFGGMRHTSARRYSFDDMKAIVIVVSETGAVTVWNSGEQVGASGDLGDID